MKKSNLTFKVLSKAETITVKGGKKKTKKSEIAAMNELGFDCPPPDSGADDDF